MRLRPRRAVAVGAASLGILPKTPSVAENPASDRLSLRPAGSTAPLRQAQGQGAQTPCGREERPQQGRLAPLPKACRHSRLRCPASSAPACGGNLAHVIGEAGECGLAQRPAPSVRGRVRSASLSVAAQAARHAVMAETAAALMRTQRTSRMSRTPPAAAVTAGPARLQMPAPPVRSLSTKPSRPGKSTAAGKSPVKISGTLSWARKLRFRRHGGSFRRSWREQRPARRSPDLQRLHKRPWRCSLTVPGDRSGHGLRALRCAESGAGRDALPRRSRSAFESAPAAPGWPDRS